MDRKINFLILEGNVDKNMEIYKQTKYIFLIGLVKSMNTGSLISEALGFAIFARFPAVEMSLLKPLRF